MEGDIGSACVASQIPCDQLIDKEGMEVWFTDGQCDMLVRARVELLPHYGLLIMTLQDTGEGKSHSMCKALNSTYGHQCCLEVWAA